MCMHSRCLCSNSFVSICWIHTIWKQWGVSNDTPHCRCLARKNFILSCSLLLAPFTLIFSLLQQPRRRLKASERRDGLYVDRLSRINAADQLATTISTSVARTNASGSWSAKAALPLSATESAWDKSEDWRYPIIQRLWHELKIRNLTVEAEFNFPCARSWHSL